MKSSKIDQAIISVSSAAKDAQELGIEVVPVMEEIAKGVSGVKTIVALLRAPKTVTDKILAYKINKFLYATDLTLKKIEKYRKNIKAADYKKLVENLFVVIDAHDNTERSKIQGKLLTALIEGTISRTEYDEMTQITSTIPLTSLDDLKKHYDLDPSTRGGRQLTFTNYGLLGFSDMAMNTIGGGGLTYPQTNLGWKYTGIIFDYPESKVKGHLIGRSDLYPELTEGGIPTGEGYPLEVLQSKSMRYKQVKLYAMDVNDNVVTVSDVPKVLNEAYPTISQDVEALAINLAKETSIPNIKKVASINFKFYGNRAVNSYLIISSDFENTQDTTPLSILSGQASVKIPADPNYEANELVRNLADYKNNNPAVLYD